MRLVEPRIPVPPGLDLPRALAVGLTAISALELLPTPLSPGLDELADTLDGEAERNAPGNEAFMNPAKSLALRLAEHTPLLWGTDPLAAAVAEHAAGALATHAGVVAHAADIAQAATATALVRRLDTGAGRDIFHDPFADDAVTEAPPPRLVLIGTAEEDPLHVALRRFGRDRSAPTCCTPSTRSRAAYGTRRCCARGSSPPGSTWPLCTWAWPPGPSPPPERGSRSEHRHRAKLAKRESTPSEACEARIDTERSLRSENRDRAKLAKRELTPSEACEARIETERSWKRELTPTQPEDRGAADQPRSRVRVGVAHCHRRAAGTAGAVAASGGRAVAGGAPRRPLAPGHREVAGRGDLGRPGRPARPRPRRPLGRDAAVPAQGARRRRSRCRCRRTPASRRPAPGSPPRRPPGCRATRPTATTATPTTSRS